MRTIVVGAGSAGSVVAARLADTGAHDVVLVEAGPDYAGDIPDDLRDGRHNSMHAHDWGFWYRATDHRTFGRIPMPFPRGRVVGGSSAVNTCIAMRGNPEDYDEWGSLGLSDWTFAKCLPAFKAIETDLDFGESEWHGGRGPLPIRRHPPDELVTWQAAFVEACKDIGFPASDDPNDPTKKGVGPHAMNKTRDGHRVSAAEAWLTADVRRRIRILDHSLVRRVRFVNGRAQGIEYERHGVVKDLPADRIVLAAGAIATPGILLRSGIGASADVLRIGATLVHESKGVGSRLLDHPGLAIFFVPRAKGMASTAHPLVQTVCRYDDMQLQAGSWIPLPHYPVPGVTIATVIGKPFGVGRLRFESARGSPSIETALLSDERDRKRAKDALAFIAQLSRTKTISDLARPVYPSRKPFDGDSFVGTLERITGSGYHPCGTAPMGTVTDGRGKVCGVEGLFIADASLMPTIPSSNTNLPTLMIGERIAQWLR